jgi:hypothetical protein
MSTTQESKYMSGPEGHSEEPKMKRVATAVLLAAISLAPVFAADQAKSTTESSPTTKTTRHTKSHGKHHHKKNTTTPGTAQPTSK